jgi:hypothetical protein
MHGHINTRVALLWACGLYGHMEVDRAVWPLIKGSNLLLCLCLPEKPSSTSYCASLQHNRPSASVDSLGFWELGEFQRWCDVGRDGEPIGLWNNLSIGLKYI